MSRNGAMSRNMAKLVAAIVLVVIGIAAASAVVALSLRGHVDSPGVAGETSTINVSGNPFNASVYLTSDVGRCRGPAGYTPCFGGDIQQAEVFNCLSAPATSSGCTQRVVSSSNPQNSYQITIQYPYVGHSNESLWANCIFTDTGDPGHYYSAYCVSTTSTSFIVTEPAPPPL